MTINTILTTVLIVATVLAFGAAAFFYFRGKTLDDLRKDAYKLFLEIENKPAYYKMGEAKMVWVLKRIRNYLPTWVQSFITDAFLEKMVRKWFKEIKDLLDDGKLNKSAEEDGNE